MWTWNCGTPTAESYTDSVVFSGERDIVLYRNQQPVVRHQVDSITFAAPKPLQLPTVQCVNLGLGEKPDRCNGGLHAPLLTSDVTFNPYKADGVTEALTWSEDGMAFGTNTNWFAIDLAAHPDTLIRSASVHVRMNRYQAGTHDHILVKYAPDQDPQSVAVSSLVTSGETINLTPATPTSYLWFARGSATTAVFSDLCLTLSKKGDDSDPIDPPTPLVTPTLSGTNLTQSVRAGNDIVPVVITADGSDVTFGWNATELPDGITAQTDGDKVTFSGSPTEAGTYTIDVTATRGTLVSDPLSISLTVTPGESSIPVLKGRYTTQTITLGDAIQEISVWPSNAEADSWTIDPATLPDGIVMTQTGNTLYFNGTPTTVGYNTFSVTANAGLLSSDPLPVSILVKTDQAPVLTSANTTQSVEAGTAIRSISISSDIDAEFAVSSLPSGLSQSISGKTLTITGSIAQMGSYTFNVTAEADGLTSAPVTINLEVVKPKVAPVLTLETLSDVSVMVGKSMPIVTFTSDSVLSYSDITVTGLPAGTILTDQGGNRFSLSGTPLNVGTYDYSITATKNGLTSQPISGTITVFAPKAPAVTAAPATQSVTVGTAITPIVFTSDSSAVTFSITALPAGLTSTDNGKTLTVSGTPTSTGETTITVTATKNGK
ncbi:MAG: putative Ig domain-containing protein, partial [Paludibacteraceae bacterium]|nr:putative Ig domain-containing protein [Paludibacteraceae bacterium]